MEAWARNMMVILILYTLLFVAAALAQDPQACPPGCGDICLTAPPKIVHTRQPRARTPVGQYADAANWQHASDVGRINGGLAEADVVTDNLLGVVTMVHNCTTNPEICVAQEARVSPDGKKIAYSVGYGNALVDVQYNGQNLGIKEIPGLTRAEIRIYDIASKTSRAVPQPAGVIDRQPDWLDNETLVMATNRGQTYPFRTTASMHEDPKRCWNPGYCVSQEYSYGRDGMSMQIWTMKIDGSQARNLTPHEQMALSPSVMTNGDILYSCWNAHGNRSFDAATSVGPSTQKNKWWLCRMDGNGADATVIVNGHKSPHLKTRDYLAPGTGGEGESQLRAIRSVAEIFKGKLAVTNYYRSNHVGSMGIIFGMDYLNPHVEGCSTPLCKGGRTGAGRYLPLTFHAITPYGQDQDMDVRREGKPPFRPMGKAGYPAPYNKQEFLITHARGQCYEVTEPYQTQVDWLKGEPSCQKAVYKVKVPMVTDPFDTAQMEMIAGGDQWQAYDARAIATYQELYGQPIPGKPAPMDASKGCYLQVEDARNAELQSPRPYDWMTTLYEQCSTQGCAVNTEDPGFHAREIRALTVYLPEMWDTSYNTDKAGYVLRRNNMGHKSIAILGSQPLEEDGSVKMRVPCETPLIMVGTDKRGLSIAHDEMLHSLREGETRTCSGCHDGHSEERAAVLATRKPVETIASKTLPTMPVAQKPITWSTVKPILDARCASCHKRLTGQYPYSAVAWDFEQIDGAFDTAAGPAPKKTSPRGGYILARPYTSKYVAKFARDSLLYWKCIGSRQDGRTDAQYGNDIDFGQAHVSGATEAECRVIGQWIDTGIQF